MTIKTDHVLDTKGLYCPEPVMMLHNKMRDINNGDVLEIHATDPATTRDIPKFCNFLGHELMAEDHSEKLYVYFVKKCV